MSSNLYIPKTCQFCNRAFVARTTTTRFCCDSCSKKAYKQRKRDEKIQDVLDKELQSLQSLQSPQIKKISTQESVAPKEFLNINETATLLGVSRWTIQRMIKSGLLCARKVGRKKIMPRSEIDNYFKNL